MMYHKYKLQIYSNTSYYTLLALKPIATLIDIKRKIHVLRKSIKPSTNSSDSFYLKQWTDLIKITNTFANSKSKNQYDNCHHLAVC